MSEVSAWNAVDASNTATPPDGWPEGQQPASVNDCGRMMMGALRREHDLITAKIGSVAGAISTTTINATTVIATGTINGGTITGTTVNSTGNANVTGTLTAATVSANQLTSTGNASVTGALSTGTLSVNAALTGYGNITGFGSLAISGAGSFGSNLSVAGAGSFNGVLSSGDTYVNGAHFLGAGGGINIIYDSTNNAAVLLDANIDLQPVSNFRLMRNQAFKPGGGVWADVSDVRTKRDVEAYSSGLAEIAALQPVRYRKNGRGGMPDTGVQYVGLVADDAREAMPELVGTVRERLDPDDAEPTELFTLDATPIIYALINAVKELTGRLETLEAGGTDDV